MICSKCGEEMRMTEKDTSSGRDIREYACDGCGHSDWEVYGTALWKILHDDREEAKAAQAKKAADAQSELSEPGKS
jgi:hypothetical protein